MPPQCSETTSGSCMAERSTLTDEIRLFLPKYLSPERQGELWTELRRFPNNRNIYSERVKEPELLQGDGWRGFVLIDFKSADRKTVSGLIISNSCDISPENRRPITPQITFAPLVNLAQYVAMLKRASQTEEQISNVLESIRRQAVTSIMYLPAISGALDESIALFGDVHSHPLGEFRAGDRALIFRLNDFGFYLFVFKLSIHFNRMMEGVSR